MLLRQTALCAAFYFYALPALAETEPPAPKPRPIASVAFAGQEVELLAMTQRARATTALQRAYIHECKSFSKIVPGYPQPPIVSFNLRVKF